MTEEEKKAIEIVKEIWQFTDYSTDKIALKVVLDLIKKLQKENEEYKLLNANIEKANKIIEGKEEYIPKDKIKGKIKEYNKEIKTYEDKMLEITQREKHLAIENKDFIKYSCIISNFTDKIKLLKNLIEEE